MVRRIRHIATTRARTVSPQHVLRGLGKQQDQRVTNIQREVRGNEPIANGTVAGVLFDLNTQSHYRTADPNFRTAIAIRIICSSTNRAVCSASCEVMLMTAPPMPPTLSMGVMISFPWSIATVPDPKSPEPPSANDGIVPCVPANRPYGLM